MKTSESIKQLSQALCDFHAKEISIKKDAVNPFFKMKYATLSAIIKATKKELNECGLSVIQLPCEGFKLETILLHSSGEFISEVYDMKPTKDDPQGQGSRITYQRRYAIGAILNLDIDDDDDGNQASKQDEKLTASGKVINPAQKSKISEKQFEQLAVRIKESKEPKDVGNLLAKARLNFIFTDDQEMKINDIIDNKQAL
ncbi:MAG: ERF family protein [Saccharofermentanaceae bacterium]|jgi:hypothetical protein